MSMPRHIIEVNAGRPEGRLRYQPACKCGWVGSDWPTSYAAYREGDDHVVYMARVEP